MVNLRELAESDLKTTLEGDFALPIELISPGGVRQTLSGQVLYDVVRFDPVGGEEIVGHDTVVTLRRSSLVRVPQPGEKWIVRIPTTPSTTAEKKDFSFDPSRSGIEGGESIGFIKLYLHEVEQSP